MTSTPSKLAQQILLSLSVISGPDAGKTRVFKKQRIKLGRDIGNDFVVSDGFVSSLHGELIVNGTQIVYCDLKSRHGSYVRHTDGAVHLHNKDSVSNVTVTDGAELQIGATLIKIALNKAAFDSNEVSAMQISDHAKPGMHTSDSTVSQSIPVREENAPVSQPLFASASESTPAPEKAAQERLITTAHQPLQTLNKHFTGDDKRLAILFRLAGQLNGLTEFDDIIDLIVDATFDAFPAANFFAVTLIGDDNNVETSQPFITRSRGTLLGTEDDDKPLLSTSILKRVVESRESVLFVKDTLGTDVTQSILDAKITACICAPLVGQRSLLGVMQVDTRGRGSLFSRQDLDLFNILASNVAFAMERAQLSASIMEMFEGFVAASVNAVEARDPVTAGHSERVADYTIALAEVVNETSVGRFKNIVLNSSELTELRYAALLHDFGKIAVPENVLSKSARLPQLCMDIIAQRFETIKALEHIRILNEFIGSNHGEHALQETSSDKLHAVNRKYQHFSQELDDILMWLRTISTASALNSEQIKRVKVIAKRTYVDSYGQQHRYLTAEEIENLCITRGTLNADEWVQMRNHASFSEQYLRRIPWSKELCRIPCIAGAHHEKLDGSGYPVGLLAEQIIPQVRMLTIADIFDALTASDRPYRKAATIDSAMVILKQEAEDNKLDRDFVDVFSTLVIPRIKHIIPSR